MKKKYIDIGCVAVYTLATAWLTSWVIRFSTQDTILYSMVIPILLAAFYRPRWMYRLMMAILAAASLAEVLLGSDALVRSLVVIAASAGLVFVTCEILLLLGEDRRSVMHALVESERRYHTLVENLPLGVYRNTPEPGGRFIMANAATVQIHGYTSTEEFLATPVASLYINPSDRARISQKLIAQGRITAEELLLKRKDGSPLWASITAVAEKDTSGKVLHFDGIIEDITHRRLAERTIIEQRMKMIASARLSALGVMARGVAHEINNPMAIISVGLEQLRELRVRGEDTPERYGAVMATIGRNIDRIQKIVRGLRNLSRDTDNEPLGTKPVPELAEDTLSVCRGRFRSSRIELIEDRIPEALVMECRGVQISQALLNLLCNAEEAVSDCAEKWIRLSCEEREDDFDLSVTDSGPGIPEPIREKIFDPFFSTKEIGKGTGLGLSVARGLVESHHGELFLDAGAAHTRFVIRLPKKQPQLGLKMAELAISQAD